MDTINKITNTSNIPLYAFFDNVDVTKYITNVNQFVFKTDNLQYQTTVGDAD